MAVNNRRLRVTELDFDNIKSNLKTFLKNLKIASFASEAAKKRHLL